jgi:hypothetical protein
MKISSEIKVYGDLTHRDTKCPKEDSESQTLVNQIRKRYPHLLFMHVKNEGKKTKAQADFDRSMGMLSGASDFLFLGSPAMCLELKRKDHTLSKWQPKQEQFLINAQEQGCFACVCFGWEAGMEAVEEWLKIKC